MPQPEGRVLLQAECSRQSQSTFGLLLTPLTAFAAVQLHLLPRLLAMLLLPAESASLRYGHRHLSQ
jgi:hypothetical protein